MARILTGARLVVAAAAAYLLILIARYFLGTTIRRHHIESAAFICAALWLVSLCFLRRGVVARPDALQQTDVVAVTAIALAAMAPALTVGLLSDDFLLRDWALKGELVPHAILLIRPLPLGLWMVLIRAGGGAVALHALSLVFHGLNTALVAAIASRLGLSRIGTVIAALVFALWPTQVEAAVWTAGIFDLSMTAAVLGAVLVVLAPGENLTRRQAIGLAALTIAGLLSKETAVALPGLIAGAAWLDREPGRRSRLVAALCVAAVCTVAYVAVRMAWRLPVAPVAVVNRYVLKEHVSRMFGSLAVPLTGATITARPMAGFALAAATTFLAVMPLVMASHRRRTLEVALTGWLLCLIASAPTVGYLLIGADLQGSRYLYLPAAGWGLFLAGSIESFEGRRMRLAARALLVFMLIVGAIQQRASVRNWKAAAAQRDQLLPLAVRAAAEAECGHPTFSGVPAEYRGAQLFTNGFPEAFLARQGPPPEGSRTCELIWTGANFDVR